MDVVADGGHVAADAEVRAAQDGVRLEARRPLFRSRWRRDLVDPRLQHDRFRDSVHGQVAGDRQRVHRAFHDLRAREHDVGIPGRRKEFVALQARFQCADARTQALERDDDLHRRLRNITPVEHDRAIDLFEPGDRIGKPLVPAPTASFYYKGKQITVGEFARKLDVKYVLDGSVRKSGATLRIAARLMKADNGFVIWSATYDRPVDDLLMVQDDIGEQVAKALKKAMNDGNAAQARSPTH